MNNGHIDSILAERGSRYGSFDKHAAVTQDIKQTMFDCRARESMAADQVEALEMICAQDRPHRQRGSELR